MPPWIYSTKLRLIPRDSNIGVHSFSQLRKFWSVQFLVYMPTMKQNSWYPSQAKNSQSKFGIYHKRKNSKLLFSWHCHQFLFLSISIFLESSENTSSKGWKEIKSICLNTRSATCKAILIAFKIKVNMKKNFQSGLTIPFN